MGEHTDPKASTPSRRRPDAESNIGPAGQGPDPYVSAAVPMASAPIAGDALGALEERPDPATEPDPGHQSCNTNAIGHLDEHSDAERDMAPPTKAPMPTATPRVPRRAPRCRR